MIPQTPGVPDHAAPKEPLLKRYAKSIAAACGVAAMVLSTGVLEENIETVVNAVLAIATAAGVYAVPNRAPFDRDTNLRA